MDYFDLASQAGGVLANVFKSSKTRFCVVSFTSDWLFPTPENKEIVRALNAAAANVSFVEIETDKGHDAFLLDEPEMFSTLKGFIDGCAEVRGLNGVHKCAPNRRQCRRSQLPPVTATTTAHSRRPPSTLPRATGR